jgi:putative ABC transport system permease protein
LFNVPVALRNLLRRPARLALTLALLASAGTLFIAATSLSSAWRRNLGKMYAARRSDVEVKFQQPEPPALAERLSALPCVTRVERWGYSPATFAREGHVDVARTYPIEGTARGRSSRRHRTRSSLTFRCSRAVG